MNDGSQLFEAAGDPVRLPLPGGFLHHFREAAELLEQLEIFRGRQADQVDVARSRVRVTAGGGKVRSAAETP
jgi:hypothetical protein